MNNQVSKEESIESIILHPTGDNKPPVENKDKASVIGILNTALHLADRISYYLTDPLIPESARRGLSSIVEQLRSGKVKDDGTGTLEYRELLEDTMQEENNKQNLKERIKHTNDIAEEAMKKWLNAKHDAVNHPSHYTTNTPIIRVKCECGKVIEVPIECIDVIRNVPLWKGNAIKYLWRAGLKKEQGLSDIEKEKEDCQKAIWYINDYIKNLKL